MLENVIMVVLSELRGVGLGLPASLSQLISPCGVVAASEYRVSGSCATSGSDAKTVLESWLPRFCAWSLILMVLGVCGCAGMADIRRSQEFFDPYSQGDYTAAAATLGGDNALDYDEENLLVSLQVGLALRAAGSFESSQVAFDRAESQLLWKSNRINSLAELLGAGLTVVGSDLMRSYRGNIYDGVLINTYKAINALHMGDEDRARVELNRADQRQTNAVDQLAVKVRALGAGDPESEAQSAAIDRTMRDVLKPDGAIARRLAAVEALGEYRDLRNPFTDWLHGVFRLATGESNRASDLFRNAVVLDGRRNRYALEDLVVAEAAAGGIRDAPARVWIVHEDGIGPHLEEFRLAFNVLTLSGLIFSAIALPEFVPGTPATGPLGIRADGVDYRTQLLLNVDRYAAMEFRAGYNAVVGKAIASAMVKTLAQVVVNEAVEDQGAIAKLLGVIANVGISATTRADTRMWNVLPHSIGVASLPRPADGRLLLSAGSGAAIDLTLPPTAFALVTVKTVSSGVPPVVHVAAIGRGMEQAGMDPPSQMSGIQFQIIKVSNAVDVTEADASATALPNPPSISTEATGAPSTGDWWAPWVSVDDRLIRRGLRDLRMARSRNVAGLLRVAGDFFNQSRKKLTAAYRFTWLDADGLPVDSILGDWQVVHALPRARAVFAGTAPRDDVAQFRLELLAASRLN
jgi:hypothetical protein